MKEKGRAKLVVLLAFVGAGAFFVGLMIAAIRSVNEMFGSGDLLFLDMHTEIRNDDDFFEE